ncbi:hypothetical protein CLOP_g12119 [Closterium sp. NIES-67]|nr:hypothetical protein CLOP_g12119 [Closterium sp. NIES-67]
MRDDADMEGSADGQPDAKASTLSPFVGQVMVPGDIAVDLKSVTSSVLRIGPGLRQEGDMVVAMRAGRLKPAGKRKLWVDSSVKRYTPAVEEAVIGVVIDKHMENLDVDIKGPGLSILPALAFEGATRRNRPNLQIGQAVYARVVKTHRDADPELSCVDASGKAAEFGPLVGGHLFDCSTGLARLLLATPTAPVLKALDAAGLAFEIAVGLNGRVWVKGESIRSTILVANAAQNAEFLSAVQQRAMVKELVRLSS